jgi:predicted aldo/keto reductase-like oxidoreductase
LDEFLSYQDHEPELSSTSWRKIEKERQELSGDFCRGCGYCQPCAVGIEIENCARMGLFLRRAPLSVYLTEEWAEKMKLIEKCKHCNACRERCPYGLDTPALLQKHYAEFKEFWAKKQAGEL